MRLAPTPESHFKSALDGLKEMMAGTHPLAMLSTMLQQVQSRRFLSSLVLQGRGQVDREQGKILFQHSGVDEQKDHPSAEKRRIL